MAHTCVRGFVLKESAVGQADRLVSILTASRGLLTAVARGAQRLKSPLAQVTQVFTLADFQLFEYKGRLTIDSADLIEPFLGLREDMERLVCAAHLAEVFVDVVRDDQTGHDVYELWAYAVQTLQSQPDPFLAVHVAQLRLLGLSGFGPDLTHCQACHCLIDTAHTSGAWFDFASCHLYCGRLDCVMPSSANVYLSAGALACLQFVLAAPTGRLFRFRLTTTVRGEVCRFSAHYLQQQMEKIYTRLNMLQSLYPESW